MMERNLTHCRSRLIPRLTDSAQAIVPLALLVGLDNGRHDMIP